MNWVWRRFVGLRLGWRILLFPVVWPVLGIAWLGSRRPRQGGATLLVLALVLELCWVGVLAAAYYDTYRATRAAPMAAPTVRPVATPRPTPTPRESPDSTGPGISPAPTELISTPEPQLPIGALTAALRVEVEHRGGYDRDLFGDWTDADGDGCNTRREVLIAESRSPVVVGPNCSLVGGRWFSEYDGVETTDPSTFDVDHMVPLAEAWSSGAWNWPAERRRRFANDLDFEGSLIAVTASSNRSKSDKDPADWVPPRRDYLCVYASTWVEVKRRWDLSVDPREKASLDAIASRC